MWRVVWLRACVRAGACDSVHAGVPSCVIFMFMLRVRLSCAQRAVGVLGVRDVLAERPLAWRVSLTR